jgi:hypothetical protein
MRAMEALAAEWTVIDRHAGTNLEAMQDTGRNRHAPIVECPFMAHRRHGLAAADRTVEIAVEHRQRCARRALQLCHVACDAPREIAKGGGLSGAQRTHQMGGENPDPLLPGPPRKAGSVTGKGALDRLGTGVDRVEADQRGIVR